MDTVVSVPFYVYLLSFATFVILVASVSRWLQSGVLGGIILSTVTMLFLAWIFFDFGLYVHRYGDMALEVKASETQKNAELAIKRPADDRSIFERVVAILSALRSSSQRENVDEWKSSSFTPQTSPEMEVGDTQTSTEPYSSEPEEVILLQEPSAPVTVPGGRCIATWQTDRDTLSYTTEVMPVGSNQWIQFTGGSLKIKKMRWYGEGTMAYQLRKDGSC